MGPPFSAAAPLCGALWALIRSPSAPSWAHGGTCRTPLHDVGDGPPYLWYRRELAARGAVQGNLRVGIHGELSSRLSVIAFVADPGNCVEERHSARDAGVLRQ